MSAVRNVFSNSAEGRKLQQALPPPAAVQDQTQRSVRSYANPSWQVVDAPFSQFAEAVRAIKLAADVQGKQKKKAKVIGITSALPREGKSMVATALAVLVAQVGAKVLFVDCDLRNPAVTRMLTPKALAGIATVLSEGCSLDDAIWKDLRTNLAFLPGLVNERIPNTQQIFTSDEMTKLFDRLRDSYDYIIVDLSPLAPVVDVRATTHLIDSYIFVVEWGGTEIEVAEHALREAGNVADKVLGVVLNKVDMKTYSRYESHRSAYYHNKHFAAYDYETNERAV